MKPAPASLAFALLLLSGPTRAQEGAPITIESKGSIRELVREIQGRSGAKLQLEEAVEDKTLSLSVKGAGFFDTVDQLCRAHGGIRYFKPPWGGGFGQLTLAAEPWVEYPTSYDESFKIIVSDLARVKSQLADSEREWCRLYLVLFGPPWIAVDYESGARTRWSLSEA